MAVSWGSKAGLARGIVSIFLCRSWLSLGIQSQRTSSGYETLKCAKPESATEIAAEYHPDAITLDLLMQPVHGLEVLLQLKNDPRTSTIPVIIVTIVDQPGVGSALGADEYLIKPVDKATLLAAVERCLRSRGGA